MEPSRTLNSTDCIARGCALQAAMLSPNFQVANFQVEEYNLQPVSITYKFKDGDKVSTKEIFKVGSSFPSTKSVTFENKVGNCQLMVHYSEGADIMKGVPTQIAQYEIGEGKKGEKTEKTSFTMRVSNNIHNVACLDEAEFIQEWTEMEKIPIKASPVTVPPKKEEEKKDGAPADAKPADADAEKKPEEDKPEAKAEVIEPEQQFEMKERKKKTFSPITFTTSNFALAPALRQSFQENETSMFAEDLDILESKELRNNLEAYSYEMRSNVDSYGTFEKYIEESVKGPFVAEITKTIDWIYGEGENAPKEEYRKLIEKFRAIGEPVRARHFYYSELEVYYAQFEKVLAHIQMKTDTIIHLSALQKDTLAKSVEVAKKLVEAVKADQAAKKLTEDPAFSLDQIINGLAALKAQTDAIFNLPPPADKKEEKKDEKMEDEEKKPEEKAPETDAKMADEEKK